MRDPELSAVSVRPILADERVRFDESLDEHHWLGHHLVGETMRYVALGSVDTDALDSVVGTWLFTQVRKGHVSGDTVALALDGKSLRGSLREDGRCVHLFSAMVHGSGIVVGQAEVDEKSNEITAFGPLLASLGDLEGALVTADAMHLLTELSSIDVLVDP